MPFSLRQKTVFCAALVLFCIISALGFFSWREHVITSQDERSYRLAADLLDQSRPGEALAIIRSFDRSRDDHEHEKWLSLEIQSLVRLKNIHRLLYLYEHYTDIFSRHEEASLLIARALIQLKNMEVYSHLRDQWRSHEQHKELWFVLDADRLILEGKTGEAIEMLNSSSFEGKADCARLTRLALLTAPEDLNGAWKLLEDAKNKDPYNQDVRSFRAQILEGIGKLHLARIEYVAAHIADPDNLILRDQLAEFYRRTGNHALAIQTWKDTLAPPSLAYIWIKTLFWSRVSRPIDYAWDTGERPSGRMQDLVDFLVDLPEDRFWDDKSFEKIPSSYEYAEARQEIYWLRIIQTLKDGSEFKALELIKKLSNTSNVYDQELCSALESILVYRRWGVLLSENTYKVKKHPPRHQFFDELKRLSSRDDSSSPTKKIPVDLDALMNSHEAFSAAFMAAGWLETSLFLHGTGPVPDDLPDWFAYGITQAYRYNRGNQAAMDFALQQKTSPSLEILIAELLIAQGRAEDAFKRLKPYIKLDSDIGYRAAWIASLSRLDMGDLRGSEDTVMLNPKLSSGTAGKEILAKIALARGDMQRADALYSSLEESSTEAKVYLSKRAYDKKQWKRARQLTTELIHKHPDNLQFAKNLEKILEKEKE